MKTKLTHPVFKIISQCADEMNIDAYVIGGWVRDLHLNRPCKDIDIVAVGPKNEIRKIGIELATAVAKKLGNKFHVNVYKNFGTAQIVYEDYDIEFVGARKESYRSESRNPIVENGTLEDDQNRRDFTINALAIALNSKNYGNLLDPFDGIKDMQEKIIRTPLDPDITYSDDPLRMMRAIRFATQLNYTIEEQSLLSIAKNELRSSQRSVSQMNLIRSF